MPALEGRPDREYAIEVRLPYWRCLDCGLTFAEPVDADLVPTFYSAYTTHADGAARAESYRLLWRGLEWFSPDPGGHLDFHALGFAASCRVLDFGCGSGRFLQTLRDAGYQDLAGCDFAPKAAAARLPWLTFFGGAASLGNEKFDLITLNHVIEHVEDVPETLRQLANHLKPGGMIYLRTPNARSLLARVFGLNWRGWETTRHPNILTKESLCRAAAASGMEIRMIGTSNDIRAGMFVGSMTNLIPWRLPRRVAILLAYVPMAWELHLGRAIRPDSGEQLVAVPG